MATIASIILSDFKKFTSYSISSRSTNILVGPNNAGKSSVLDALRIAADVLRYSKQNSPSLREQSGIGVCATYAMSHRAISIPIGNIVRNYADVFARLEYKLTNGNSLHVHMNPEEGIFAFVQSDAAPPRTASAFRHALELDIVVVPTLSALEEEENYVLDETVRRNEHTRLASRNFRNIVHRQTAEQFAIFEALCREGWSTIKVGRPEVRAGSQVTMMYEENRIPREVFWSGFGFQVWMQMMLQFLRARESSILVLDEPDIYLHPDLQRRLIAVAKGRFSQIFVATHSTEIINDADPGDILMVDAAGRSARRINTDEGYRRVYSYLGSSENAEFARIAKAKRIVFFEGKERNLIKKFSRKVGLGELLDDPYTLYLQAGGFSQWRRIKEIDWAFHEIFGIDAKIGALFDKDYRCSEEVEEFQRDLENESLWVAVLDRKEIENYALELGPITRTIAERTRGREIKLSEEQITQLLEVCSEPFRGNSQALYASNYVLYHRERRKSVDEAQHLAAGIARFDLKWKSLEERLKVLPGKEFISALSTQLQKQHGVSVTIHQILDEMRGNEVSAELVEKLTSLSEFFKV